MKKILLFSILALLFFTNCSNDDVLSPRWYIFVEAQEENPWGVGQESSDTDVIAAIESYLSGLDVDILETTIEYDFGPVVLCVASPCPSVRAIHIKANVEYEATLLSEGFILE